MHLSRNFSLIFCVALLAPSCGKQETPASTGRSSVTDSDATKHPPATADAIFGEDVVEYDSGPFDTATLDSRVLSRATDALPAPQAVSSNNVAYQMGVFYNAEAWDSFANSAHLKGALAVDWNEQAVVYLIPTSNNAIPSFKGGSYEKGIAILGVEFAKPTALAEAYVPGTFAAVPKDGPAQLRILEGTNLLPAIAIRPTHLSGLIALHALNGLPTKHSSKRHSELSYGVFRDQATWNTFARKAKLDPQLDVDFGKQAVAYVVHTQQTNSLSFASLNNDDGELTLNVNWDRIEPFYIDTTPATFVVIPDAATSLRIRVAEPGQPQSAYKEIGSLAL